MTNLWIPEVVDRGIQNSTRLASRLVLDLVLSSSRLCLDLARAKYKLGRVEGEGRPTAVGRETVVRCRTGSISNL